MKAGPLLVSRSLLRSLHRRGYEPFNRVAASSTCSFSFLFSLCTSLNIVDRLTPFEYLTMADRWRANTFLWLLCTALSAVDPAAANRFKNDVEQHINKQAQTAPTDVLVRFASGLFSLLAIYTWVCCLL